MLFESMTEEYKTDLFDHGFGLGRSHGYVLHFVLVAQVAHNIVWGVEHLTQVGVEPKMSAHIPWF